MGKHTGRMRRGACAFERIQRTNAFKRFKAENLEKFQAEIEDEAALRDKLVSAFLETPEGKEVERRVCREPMQLRVLGIWLREEIFFRSDIFRKWCQDNNIPPWPKFLEIHSPRGVRTTTQEEFFNKFKATEPARSASERWGRRDGQRGWGIKDLMPSGHYAKPKCSKPSELTAFEKKIAEFPPLTKALIAYDLSHFGFSPVEIIPLFMDHAISVVSRRDRERFLMEITRLLFPQTKGKHPAYDDEANRCLQQVKRWIAKIEELIRLMDNP